MDADIKQRILESFLKGDLLIRLRKDTPVSGPRKDPTGISSQIKTLGLQHFRCQSFIYTEPGQAKYLVLYSNGQPYFTDGENRCWEILVIKSLDSDGGWYMDIVNSHGAIPAPLIHELSGILKFLEDNKSFVG